MLWKTGTGINPACCARAVARPPSRNKQTSVLSARFIVFPPVVRRKGNDERSKTDMFLRAFGVRPAIEFAEESGRTAAACGCDLFKCQLQCEVVRTRDRAHRDAVDIHRPYVDVHVSAPAVCSVRNDPVRFPVEQAALREADVVDAEPVTAKSPSGIEPGQRSKLVDGIGSPRSPAGMPVRISANHLVERVIQRIERPQRKADVEMIDSRARPPDRA